LPLLLRTFFLLTLLGTAACVARPADPSADGLLDLDGHPANPFAGATAQLFVFVFVQTDCPVSNAFAPEIIRLHKRFAPRGVAFCLVYPDPDESPAAIRRHLRDFGYPFGAVRDPRHLFARKSQVHVTPEAAIYRANRELLYHGRIDDRYVDFGKVRPAPTRRDLALALGQAIEGRPVAPASGPAIGCFVDDLR
jgi:hypothetical protein